MSVNLNINSFLLFVMVMMLAFPFFVLEGLHIQPSQSLMHFCMGVEMIAGFMWMKATFFPDSPF